MPKVLEAPAQVLREYRVMRQLGMPPHQAITEIRHAYADRIAAAVAACQPADTNAIACWQAADSYARSMLSRPPYWWRPA